MENKQRTFKKWHLALCVIITLVTLTALLAVSAGAATSGYYTYTVFNGEATITDVSIYLPGPSGNVTIPSTLGGYPVTSIGPYAFETAGLKSITIPDSVRTIDDNAFSYCSKLTSITFGKNSQLERIGWAAFFGCSSLRSITIPDSVWSIGEAAFKYCGSLTNIIIPEGVAGISQGTFYGCGSLKSVTFGENSWVGNIGNYAFYDCTGLTSFEIPSRVTSIGTDAFSNCTGLMSIEIPSRVQSIDAYAFYGCTSLKSITFQSANTTIHSISSTIPSRATIYGYNGSTAQAYATCFGRTFVSMGTEGVVYTLNAEGTEYSVTDYTGTATEVVVLGEYKGLPVTSIGAFAFYNCSSLTSITIPSGVTNIGSWAFDGCTRLTSITIPSSVRSIGYKAFFNCTSLIQVENGVSYVDRWVVGYSDSLNQISLRENTVGIADSSFSGCTGLTSVTIPSSVTSISYYVFSGCTGLTSITVADGNMAYHADGNCLIETASKTLIAGCKNSVIPTDGSVTSIGKGAFRGCSSLTSITIPGSVTSIGEDAFYNCTGLTSITIPLSVTSIGDYAFCDCNSLTSVTFLSPNTAIYSHNVTIPSTATIYGYTGSTAEAYATKYSRSFVSIGDFQPKINTANIALGSDITVYYYVTLPEQMKDAVMEFAAGDKTATVAGTLTTTPNRYVFAFEGITPQMIGDNISVRVLYTHPTLGELEVATHNNYSVKKYCLNMMNAGAAALKMTAEQYAALTTLVADTLEYGAKVQLYRGYHTDALVNEGITGQSTFVPLADAYAAGKVSTTTAVDGTKLSGASAVLDNTIRLRFSFVTSDVSRVTLKIGNTVYDSDDFVATGAMSGGLPVYSVNSAPLSAHQMEDIFALSLCVDGVEVQSYAYGVVNYLYSKQNDGSALLSDLIRAIRNYGLSAVAYRDAMGQ